MSYVTIYGKSRLWAPAVLAVALAACSGGDKPADGSTAAPANTAPANAPVVAEKVQAMDTEQLRDAASAALRENRMYSPAGENAVEFYLALRDKLPDDASIKSALTDLQPYTLIAAEQSLTREDFSEASRLIGLIEKVDATAPALPRLKQGVEQGAALVAKRSDAEAAKAKADTDNRAKAQAEQQRAAQQAEQQAAAARQIAAQQDAARKESERLQAEQQAAAKAQAETRAPAAPAQPPAPSAPAAAPTLRAVSTPAPRFPADALRSGTAGEVVVEITVGTDGSVSNARVLRATPQRVFDREALAAVKRWRFEPISAPVTTRRTLAFDPKL